MRGRRRVMSSHFPKRKIRGRGDYKQINSDSIDVKINNMF